MFLDKRDMLKCPACGKADIESVDHFKWRDFDGSLFNMAADLGLCAECGFVRVGVPFGDEQITDHYASHSLYTSLGGVGVGGSTAEDVARYQRYLAILGTVADQSASIGDVGCAKGGLLNYLGAHSGSGKRLVGIDVDRRALDSLSGIEAVHGNALSLDLDSRSLDLAFYIHVIEHVMDVDRVLSEMTRVVVKGGYVLVEVPDATGYSADRVHDFYWIGMKEHVNHFTPAALCRLLNRHGLEVERVVRSRLPMIGGVYYPSLIVLARVADKTGLDPTTAASGEVTWLAQHMKRERLFAAKTRHNLEAFLSRGGEPAVWGIGLEYFNLLALDVLPTDCASILLDSNPCKQSQTVSGCRVLAPESAPLGSSLICSASLSWRSIVERASVLGFDKKEIFCI